MGLMIADGWVSLHKLSSGPPESSLLDLRDAFLSRGTFLSQFILEHHLHSYDDETSTRAVVYACCAVQRLSNSGFPHSSTFVAWSEEALRGMHNVAMPQLAGLITNLILLQHTRNLGIPARTALLSGAILAFTLQIGLHLPPTSETLLWRFDPSPSIAEYATMYANLFWLIAAMYNQVLATGMPYCPLELSLDVILVSLPGRSEGRPQHPDFLLKYDMRDKLATYAKSSVLLGSVHQYRRRLGLGQASQTEYCRLLDQLFAFQTASLQLRRTIASDLSDLATLHIGDLALIQLYESNLQTSDEGITHLWELLSRMSAEATVVHNLIQLERQKTNRIDGFLPIVWSIAGLLAGDMNDYLGIEPSSTQANFWSGVVDSFIKAISSLRSMYPVADRLESQLRPPRPSRLPLRDTHSRGELIPDILASYISWRKVKADGLDIL